MGPMGQYEAGRGVSNIDPALMVPLFELDPPAPRTSPSPIDLPVGAQGIAGYVVGCLG